jgi:hypothetical protein
LVKIAYWIIAGLLGLFYLYAGGKKLSQTNEQLAPMMGWVDTVPMLVVRLIGVIEVLGVAGLILPPLTGIAQVMAMVGAIGFVVLQVLATGLHVSRGEAKVTTLNFGLIALAGVAVWLSTAWI